MAHDNAEIVRAAYDRLNRGDVEGLIELCHEDFSMDMTERVFNPDTYTGHDGIRRFYDGVTEAWERYHWDVEGTRVAGDDVVALLHCTGTGQGGVSVDWHVAWLWRVRDGKAAALRFYRDPAAALEAAGLRE